MGMTQPPGEDGGDDALCRRAAIDQRTTYEAVRSAVHDDVDLHDRIDTLDEAAAWVVENFRDALDRLGRA
jgi:hypothetical protein